MENNFYDKNVPIYSPSTFSEFAQEQLIHYLLSEDFFKEISIQRQLASYPVADDDEKDIIILKIMKHYWNMPAARNYFKVFRDFDSVFKILGKKGHFIHQFEVFLLGYFLNTKLIEAHDKLKTNDLFKEKNRLQNAWLMTSTAHDFGYPIELHEELTKKFSELYRKLDFNEISKEYGSIVQKFNIDDESRLSKAIVFDVFADKKVTVNIPNFIAQSVKSTLSLGNKKTTDVIESLKSSHGYISAVILCKSYLKYLSKIRLYGSKSDEWRVEDLKKAVGAIAIHSTKSKSVISKISFSNNPLAYMLFLVDNLQEWNRVLRPHEKYPSYNLIDFESATNTIYLKYVLTHEKWTTKMIENAEKNIREKEKL